MIVMDAPVISDTERQRRREELAKYCGYQEGAGPWPGFNLWTLKRTLSPQLVEGSTITEETLDAFIGQ